MVGIIHFSQRDLAKKEKNSITSATVPIENSGIKVMGRDVSLWQLIDGLDLISVSSDLSHFPPDKEPTWFLHVGMIAWISPYKGARTALGQWWLCHGESLKVSFQEDAVNTGQQDSHWGGRVVSVAKLTFPLDLSWVYESCLQNNIMKHLYSKLLRS